VRLTEEFGKGFDERELRRIRQFYLAFPKWDALRPELSWTHYRLLIRVQDEAARQWYMNEAAEQTWSSRQLDRQISVLYYERLLASKDTRPVREEAAQNLSLITPQEFIHDPYVLEFLNLKDYPALRETDIEKALISNLQEFLLELGKGFCFVARQKRMRYEEEDFYVDLVFYHSILKCHVLIDLKLGKLSHQDVGQMDSYIRMFDDLYKHPDDNPTLGLILCSDKNEAVVKYSVLAEHRQIFASKYLLELPAPEILQREIMRERKQLEG
jgi:predicted nuclease of restriction endonuclease-like (RecB) superfamily